MKKVRIGIIGFGTVGTGTVRILQKNASHIQERLGCGLEIKTIADLDTVTDRGADLKKIELTADATAVTDDPGIDIAVELIGGVEPARSLILRAVRNGKPVVTANKALLCDHGFEIFSAAAERGVGVGFEASVGGGIPIIRAVKDAFASDRIVSMFGILNGTANYILSRMTSEAAPFKEVLRDAQQQGYAEADPTFDIEGIDTLHKLCVLISLAARRRISAKKVYTEGITNITPLDIEFARELGYRIKLLAICRSTKREVDARVHPALVPESHMLSRVNGTYNAVFLHNRDAGPTMLYGQGAGMMPTGSAVVADIMECARSIRDGVSPQEPLYSGARKRAREITLKPFREVATRYYVRFTAADKTGVLSRISGILGRCGISIHSVVQKGRRARGGTVSIFMLTHQAREADMQRAIKQIDRLDLLRQKTVVIRIEDGILNDEAASA